MPELSATLAGVAFTSGLAALLAAATGATVKIAGNELGANGVRTRVTTALIGLSLVGWSAWSMREQPFEVSAIEGDRLDLVSLDRKSCRAVVEVAVFVRFRRAPGTVRYEVRFGPEIPVRTFSQKLKHSGSGADLLGPKRIRLPANRPKIPLRPEVVIVSPNLVRTRDINLGGPPALGDAVRKCRLT